MLIALRFYWYKITRQKKCAIHQTALVKAPFTIADIWYCEQCDNEEHARCGC